MQITHYYRKGEEVAGDLFEESEYNDINSELSETNPPKYGISSFALLMNIVIIVRRFSALNFVCFLRYNDTFATCSFTNLIMALFESK